MKLFLILTFTLALQANFARASDWLQYNHLGTCTMFPAQDGVNAVMNFYVEGLQSKNSGKGFITLNATDGKETQILGGIDAQYTLNADRTEVTVVSDNETVVIPLGTNVTVIVDNSGSKLLCNTQL